MRAWIRGGGWRYPQSWWRSVLPAAPSRVRRTTRTHAATVVASTDVWGSVAGAVAGDHATVTSILDSAVDDPHSYEATPANAAAIADASLVVFNGGDYDHWVDDVLANNPDVPTVDAYSLRPDPQQPANEHVFYDPATAKAVAAQVADRLAQIDAEPRRHLSRQRRGIRQEGR